MRFPNLNKHNFPPIFYGNILHVSNGRGSGETVKIPPCEHPQNQTSKAVLSKFRIEQPGKIKLFLFISPVTRTQFFTKWKLKAVFLYGIITQNRGGSEVGKNQPENHPLDTPKVTGQDKVSGKPLLKS